MRKDLQAAFEMAAESQPLSYYKDILIQFQEELAAESPAPVKKAGKKAGKAAADGEDEDVNMADAEDADEAAGTKKEKTKKRKAEEAAEVYSPIRDTAIASLTHSHRHPSDPIRLRSPRSS